jgi:hypothetical protein
MTAIQEFVVPKSMPNTFAIKFLFCCLTALTAPCSCAIAMPRGKKTHGMAANKGKKDGLAGFKSGKITSILRRRGTL